MPRIEHVMQGSALGKKFISQLATGNLILVASWLLVYCFWLPVPFLVARNIPLPGSTISLIYTDISVK